MEKIEEDSGFDHKSVIDIDAIEKCLCLHDFKILENIEFRVC